MKHVTVKLYTAILKNIVFVSNILVVVFTIQAEILRRLQCKDTKISQYSFQFI